jgi:hypothetical protein
MIVFENGDFYMKKICKTCSIELKKNGQTRKGFCCPKCEILGKIKINEKGCWIWLGHRFHDAYGLMNFDYKNHVVHRVTYEIYKGEIPKGLYVRHKCDVSICCNPDHLEIGTQLENIHDAIERKRFRSKLSWNDVCEMRRLHAEGMTIYRIGKNYNLSYAHAWHVVNLQKRITR